MILDKHYIIMFIKKLWNTSLVAFEDRVTELFRSNDWYIDPLENIPIGGIYYLEDIDKECRNRQYTSKSKINGCRTYTPIMKEL